MKKKELRNHHNILKFNLVGKVFSTNDVKASRNPLAKSKPQASTLYEINSK